jgi:hypothetical protein
MKSVEVTIKVAIDVDDTIVEINDIPNQLVVCFYKEDTYGTEHFLPKTEGLTITEYIDTRIDSIDSI